MSPLQDPAEEAKRILKEASKRDIKIRLIGGVAIQILCPSFREGSLYRECHDIDLVGLSNQTREIRDLAKDLGYIDEERFNALHGHRRLLFYDDINHRDLDVFVDRLRQCHDLNLRKRLDNFETCLPPADLLLSKLQVMHINEKDIRDVICLLQDCPLGDHDDYVININYISGLLGSNWGFWKTIMLNLQRVKSYIFEELDEDIYSIALDRIDSLERMLIECPKSIKWKLRNIIGDRIRWYEIPEDRNDML